MKFVVKFFARARDLAGSSELEIEVSEPHTVAGLKHALADFCPQLRPLVPHLLVAVGQDYARDGTVIPPGAEIACFPPVSGG